MKQSQLQHLLQEIEFLRELKVCENVITLEKVFEDQYGIHLVLRCAQHGTLKNILKSKKLLNEA